MKFEFKGNINNTCKFAIRPDLHQNDEDIEHFLRIFVKFLRKNYQIKIKERFETDFGDKIVVFEKDSSEGNGKRI